MLVFHRIAAMLTVSETLRYPWMIEIRLVLCSVFERIVMWFHGICKLFLAWFFFVHGKVLLLYFFVSSALYHQLTFQASFSYRLWQSQGCGSSNFISETLRWSSEYSKQPPFDFSVHTLWRTTLPCQRWLVLRSSSCLMVWLSPAKKQVPQLTVKM